MHRRKGAWRSVLSALALVTFALPLAQPLTSTVANAQTTGNGTGTPAATVGAFPGSAASAFTAVASPAIAVNPLGVAHTVTFTCGAYGGAYSAALAGTAGAPIGTTTGELSTATGSGTAGAATGAATAGAGCYNVVATAQDITNGTAVPFISGTCAGIPAQPNTSSINCAPASTFGTPSPIPGAATTATATSANQVTGTINPASPHAYLVTFTGFIPAFCPSGLTFVAATGTATSGCYPTTSGAAPTPGTPAFTSGFTCPSGTTLGTAGPVPGAGAPPAGTTVCYFTVAGSKKYVEATTITLTPTSGTCGTAPPLLFIEGLKTFYGRACTVTAVVSGTVIIKTGVDCTQEPTGNTAALTAEFGTTAAKYSCVNGSLMVTGVPLGAGVPITFTTTSPGTFNGATGVTAGLCAGTAGGLTTSATTNGAGAATVTICPTGAGVGSVTACVASTINTQPAICSTAIAFTYTAVENRVVPQVRWAGEKIALTKCFGIPFAPVEFTLMGDNPGLNATLLPAALGTGVGTGASGAGLGAGSAPYGYPSQNTVFVTTDGRGCATVIAYAAGEGVLNVDAALYSTAGGTPPTVAGTTTPIINEHAFEVYYLKFDHVDLENVAFSTYSTATALQPYLSSFIVGNTLGGASVFPTSFTLPGPPGSGSPAAGATGYSIPLCANDYVRAMVHGYFEIPGDPSGRPASTVAVPNAPAGSAGSYTLPAGRWVLPEDWPLLATFAGFSASGVPTDLGPSSVFAWDINSGYAFNPTGEKPVFCTGGTMFGGNSGYVPVSAGGAVFFGSLASGNDFGPCFGTDAKGTFYSTAPAGACAGGATVGIGPFDPAEACTNNFGTGNVLNPSNQALPYSPPGSTIVNQGSLAAGCTTPPCLNSVSNNSTYLPNGTLNQWDAPMPPAQVSFGVTGGPGLLFQVAKDVFYEATFSAAAGAGNSCPTGYTYYAANGACFLSVDTNPFYGEAIPASPLIPPIMNNGGYLWDSWGFAPGVTAVVLGTAPFAGTAAGGFVPGQSTFATAAAGFFATPCSGTGAPGTPAAGNCSPYAGGGTVPGGINVSPVGAGCAPASTAVTIADTRGFMVGMPLSYYSAYNGAQGTFTSGTTATITAVTPTPTGTNPNQGVLSFNSTANGFTACDVPGSDVFYANQYGFPVANANAFSATLAAGGSVSISTPTTTAAGSKRYTAPVVNIDTTNNIVYVGTADNVASFFGTCTGVSRTNPFSSAAAASSTGACEPAVLTPPGTILEGAATQASVPPRNAPPNPYPFWQWLPAPPAANSVNRTATVYSDNHGEAVVELYTGLGQSGLTVAPTAGACTSNYAPITINGVVTACELNFQTVTGSYAGIGAAYSNFSSAKPGCIQTFTSGTTAVLPGVQVGATGPAPGQICINSLGGIEFGSSATLGSTTVQAVADYPYTRGVHPAVSSAILTKLFSSAFAKTLSVNTPGTPAPAGTTSYTVTVTAQDVCGNPITAEPVNVYVLSGNAGAAVIAPVSVGSLLSSSSTAVSFTVPASGTATLSLEVLNSAVGNGGVVVKAVFPYERIERFVTVIPGSAGTPTTTVVYPPGWQQVGGPKGSNFSVAEALFAWNTATQSYTNATAAAGNIDSSAPTCTGYWAYFAAAMSVTLPAAGKTGDTAACSLAAGYNLVGNPFGTPASISTLPAGSAAYHWNGTTYDNVSIIPTGGSVWIYVPTPTTVTLTAT